MAPATVPPILPLVERFTEIRGRQSRPPLPADRRYPRRAARMVRDAPGLGVPARDRRRSPHAARASHRGADRQRHAEGSRRARSFCDSGRRRCDRHVQRHRLVEAQPLASQRKNHVPEPEALAIAVVVFVVRLTTRRLPRARERENHRRRNCEREGWPEHRSHPTGPSWWPPPRGPPGRASAATLCRVTQI